MKKLLRVNVNTIVYIIFSYILNYDESRYFQFINEYCHLMPRIMLRNAIEFLDEDIRVNILVSSKEKRDSIKRK